MANEVIDDEGDTPKPGLIPNVNGSNAIYFTDNLPVPQVALPQTPGEKPRVQQRSHMPSLL